MNDLLSVLNRVVQSDDEREGRYYGNVSGVVTDVSDPESMGRVKVRLRGMGQREESDWMCPMWPGAIEGVPHVKDPVLVCFEDGNVNRGFYVWLPTSNTQNRPQEWMVLGLTFASMYNHLATQFNQLRTDFNSLCTSLPGHTHGGVTAGAASTGAAVGVSPASTSASTAGKVQKADGSTVTASSGDKKALSGRAKVGI